MNDNIRGLIERARRIAWETVLRVDGTVRENMERAVVAAIIETQGSAEPRDADRIASLEAEVAALREQMEHEAASMWRGAVSNTVAVVDRVRNQFAKGLRLKKNVRLAHFDAELDIALGEWFVATRRTSPKSYAESEALFRALLNRGDGNA